MAAAADYNEQPDVGTMVLASYEADSTGELAHPSELVKDMIFGPALIYMVVSLPATYLRECQGCCNTYMQCLMSRDEKAAVFVKQRGTRRSAIVAEFTVVDATGAMLANCTVVAAEIETSFCGMTRFVVAVVSLAETVSDDPSSNHMDKIAANFSKLIINTEIRAIAGNFFGDQALILASKLRELGVTCTPAAWTPYVDNGDQFWVHANVMFLLGPCEDGAV